MEETLYYNAVALALRGDRRGIGTIRKYSGTWRAAYEWLRLTGASLPDPAAAWRGLEKRRVRLLLPDHEEYPRLLREAPDPPLGIYIRGSLPGGKVPFAIVGTRRATPDGKAAARRFAREIAAANIPIVSGLAMGIDAAAHEGCLEAAAPTVAVLAGGLDEVYPKQNEYLARRILEKGGTLVSEYPFRSPPYPARFLERNRIIAGLARGVLIVEAPAASGALVTARRAAEAGRDVFAIPGAITHANSAGPHALIRQGAELVTAPGDIFTAYGIARARAERAAARGSSPEETLILKALREHSAPAEVDKIIAMTKLEPRIVNQTLGFLLSQTLIRETAGGYTI